MRYKNFNYYFFEFAGTIVYGHAFHSHLQTSLILIEFKNKLWN